VQIAERGSLTAAAETLGKSLPSVVRSLGTLESSLGVRLFNRTTRRIALTEEGKVYLEQCRKILADVEEAERALGQYQAEPSGTISVTAPVRFGELHVASAVSGFLNRYPKTQVNLLLLDRVVDLLEEGIDIAVRIAHLGDSSLIAKPIGSIRQVVCASQGLLDRLGVPERPEELSELPCVRFTGISASSNWDFQESGKRLTVHVNGGLTCNQAGGSLEACVAGVGFGRFFCYQVMPFVRNGDLSILLSEFEPPPVPLSLVYPHSRLLSPRVRAMVDWLVKEIRQSLDATYRD